MTPEPASLVSLPNDLGHAIEAFCEAPSLRQRRASFVQIVRWTREGHRRTTELSRLLALVQALEADAELRQKVQHSLRELLGELDCLALFAEAGLPSTDPFTTEILQRLVAKFMPSAREDSDARKLLIDL